MSVAAAGIDLDAESMVSYQAMMSHEYRYVTYKMDGGKLKTDKKGPDDATYQNFLADLKVMDDCRYALVDFPFSINSQGKNEPSTKTWTFLVNWCPDTANIKSKMLYSSSFDSVKTTFMGVTFVIQASNVADIDQATLENKLKSSDGI